MSANRNKGEVALRGETETYIIRFSADSLCRLEDELDMGVNQVARLLGDVDTMRVKLMIVVLWAGLLDRQPDITIEDAKKIVTEVTLFKSMKAVSDAFALTFGSADEGEAVRPTVAEAAPQFSKTLREGTVVGTGSASSGSGKSSSSHTTSSGEARLAK